MSEFGLPFWGPFWDTFWGHFGVPFWRPFWSLRNILIQNGVKMGTQNGVKWWIHQKTVPEPPFHKKTSVFMGKN